jgi:dTDP-4-dehydrorhamnose reductase
VSGRSLRAVINCAAYTAVDKAESNPELAEQVNAIAPGILAQETARAGIPIIHISTDYVFNGKKTLPYIESDAVDPINVYGRTKEAGETAVRAANPNHAIIRTSWVLAAEGLNFLNTILRLSVERGEVSVVDDQFGCPTSADDIASATMIVFNNLDSRGGTWHFVNDGDTSWHGLAQYIFSYARRRGLRTPVLHAIPTSDYPTPAKRPVNSKLATKAIETDFSIKPGPWQDAVDRILATRLG